MKKSIKLVDYKDGKRVKWQKYKLTNLELSESFERINQYNDSTKAKRLHDCGKELIFKQFVDDSKKLKEGNFCKVRLCPACAWRRSLKTYGQVSKIVNTLEDKKEYAYLFLTVSLKNCTGDELSDNITHLLDSFKRMVKFKQFEISFLGYFRNLEVTYKEENGTFHPHIHTLLVVERNYFTSGYKDKYISQAQFTEMWQRACRIDYTPIVHIKKVNKNREKAVAELAKYSVKSSHLIIKDKYDNIDEEVTDYVVATMDKALASRRLTTYGGILKKLHKELNLSDLNAKNIDLNNTDIEEEIRTDMFHLVVYQWDYGLKNYYHKKNII